MVRLSLPAVIVALVAGAFDPAPTFGAAAELNAVGSAPAPALAEAARKALGEHDLPRAALLAALASAKAPEDAGAALMLGLARFRDGMADAAVAPFERAVTLAPTSAAARFDLGAAQYESGRFAAAETTWLGAATLDAKIAPLATLDAGLAALDGGAAPRALRWFAAAESLARAAGQVPVAQRALSLSARAAAVTRAAHAGNVPTPLRQQVHAAREALVAHHYDEAIARYRAAADAAELADAAPADRAEIDYGLGQALYRQGALTAAARALDSALARSPDDAEFHFLLGLVHFDAGADRDAQRSLVRALELTLPTAEAQRAREILRSLREAHRSETRRLFIDVDVSAGYDSNVPQSGIVITAARSATLPTGAAFLSTDLEVFWRPIGTTERGLTIDYRFGQLGYLSPASALDPYSLQEHDLTVAGAWTPTPRLTLAAGVDGYVLFAGVQTFTPFQAGASLGPRIEIRETHGFETRLRYQHVFKTALDQPYKYLGGQRDEAGVTQAWRDQRDRLSLGYVFAREAIGTQIVTLGQLSFPDAPAGSFDPAAIYYIPYSYLGHELSLTESRDLPWGFHGALTLRYEHRDYQGQSYIGPPAGQSGPFFDYRTRRDNRFSADLALRYPIAAGFDVEAAYTFIVNRSTIDNDEPTSTLDYDDKNYLKSVVQLTFGFTY